MLTVLFACLLGGMRKDLHEGILQAPVRLTVACAAARSPAAAADDDDPPHAPRPPLPPPQKNTEFGYSRKDVIIIGVGLIGAGYALYYGLQARDGGRVGGREGTLRAVQGACFEKMQSSRHGCGGSRCCLHALACVRAQQCAAEEAAGCFEQAPAPPPCCRQPAWSPALRATGRR